MSGWRDGAGRPPPSSRPKTASASTAAFQGPQNPLPRPVTAGAVQDGEGDTCVRVVARVRPLLSDELAEGCRPCISVFEEGAQLVHGKAGLSAAERITEALFSGDPATLSEADLEQLALDGLPADPLPRGDFPPTFSQLLAQVGVAAGKQIKDALPGYYFSQDLKNRPTEALQLAARQQGASFLGTYGTSSAGYALLVTVNALMLVGVVALIHRRRRTYCNAQAQPLLKQPLLA